MNSFSKKTIVVTLCFIVLIGVFSPVRGVSDVPLRDKFNYGTEKDTMLEYYRTVRYPYYLSILEDYEKNGYMPAIASAVVVEPEKIRLSNGENAVLETGIGGSSIPAFKWSEDIPWVEWDFMISTQGLYEIEIEYYMMPGSGNPAVRSLKIDGKVPFLEAVNIVFNRGWKDEGEPVINSIGDEVRPGQVEVPKWRNVNMCDGQGLYSQPFQFYLESGEHVLQLEYIDQPMAISQLRVKPVTKIPVYEQVKEQYIQKGYSNVSRTVEFQAESSAIEKSDPAIRRESDGDPICKPASYLDRKLNVLGGYRWRRGNQAITWKFSVPEDGLYKIGIRAAQWWNDGLPSFRQIAVDNRVPFKELEEYKFVFDRKWRTEVLQDDKGDPFLFYLTQGEHTLTMTVKLGSLTPVIYSLNEDSILLSNILRDIIKVTGSNPDPNYDYDFFKTIPNLKNDIETLVQSLQKKHDMMKDISEKLPAMASNMLTIKSQLEGMVKDPFSIAKRINDLNSAQTNFGNWYLSLQNQPLLIDYFLAGSPDEIWKNKQSNIFQKLYFTFANFLISFKKDYDNIGSTISNDMEINKTINVWVARGTEWAELIKEMADEDFTPDTGIKVNINVFPPSQLQAGSVNALLLSINSGKAPDAALGVGSNSPVEFAIRDAVLDLGQFQDFSEVSDWFIPNIFIPYKYREGIYAIPETMDFTVMFYRKDIAGELGLKLPDTREDLYSHVLPVLYQNGLQFYYPADFTHFIFQNGGEYYTPDGLKSALDRPEAFRAFREYTELYTHYAVPVSASFFNRMRTGEMPVGIGSYGLYMQLSVAAPELAGRWGIAPLPGTLRPDGIVDRSNGALAGQCGIIIKQTKNPEETWKFLKWWMSTPVQTRFARELEALIGVEARWNTANVNAFTSLAWKKEDLDVIQEQWKWAKEIPVILGGYFTGRHIGNAWNSVVIGGVPVRDAIEKAVEEINRELRMKQEEYGIITN
ncbi:MAG TPA: extracellular solute-binding protein [Clostridiales bacterium]|nr:extracellular solute-binding protein [Clostridiales bacterium]